MTNHTKQGTYEPLVMITLQLILFLITNLYHNRHTQNNSPPPATHQLDEIQMDECAAYGIHQPQSSGDPDYELVTSI